MVVPIVEATRCSCLTRGSSPLPEKARPEVLVNIAELIGSGELPLSPVTAMGPFEANTDELIAARPVADRKRIVTIEFDGLKIVRFFIGVQ